MRRLLIAAALLLVAPLAAAQAYKWTDSSGTVHYSDAPPQGTQYRKVTTTGTVEPLAAPAPASEGPKETTRTSNNTQPGASMADTPENRTKFCASLKGNLDALKSSGPVLMNEGGQQKVVGDDQRKQQQATAEAQYQQYCSGY